MSRAFSFITLLCLLVAQRRCAWGQPSLPPAPVGAATAVSRRVTPTQSFVGTVRPSRKATIGSAVDGRVTDFFVQEGDRVARNQPLAQLLTNTISLELAVAEAELQLRQHELAELTNGARPEEKASAKAELLNAQARMKYSQSRRKRIASLFQDGQATSEEERDEAVSAALAAEQVYAQALADYELVLAGPRDERIDQARARVAMQQATVDLLRDRISKHTIVSRFDGFVTAEFTEVGQWMKQGDLVAEVAALDDVEIVAYVVEGQIPFVTPGVAVTVEIPAIPDEIFTGTVVRVIPQADLRARTFPVIVRAKNVIENDNPLLKSGMLARVNLPAGDVEDSVLVPKDALVLGGSQPVVFVIEPTAANSKQGIAHPVEVELGVTHGNLIAVEGGVDAGQLVVVLGNERLRPGQQVVVTETVE